jgi:hypothetical protein
LITFLHNKTPICDDLLAALKGGTKAVSLCGKIRLFIQREYLFANKKSELHGGGGGG